MKWISAHIFYPHLRGKNESFNTFAASLDALNDDFWGKLEQIAPTDWKTDLFYTIVDGLKGTVANKGEFINQLKARLL
jgi:hypothetical protein